MEQTGAGYADVANEVERRFQPNKRSIFRQRTLYRKRFQALTWPHSDPIFTLVAR